MNISNVIITHFHSFHIGFLHDRKLKWRGLLWRHVYRVHKSQSIGIYKIVKCYLLDMWFRLIVEFIMCL
jgi:hypothetical protein